jgi:hypothetical protein
VNIEAYGHYGHYYGYNSHYYGGGYEALLFIMFIAVVVCVLAAIFNNS